MNLIPTFIRRRIEHRPNLLKIVDNIGWLFFDKILRMGVGLIVGVWVARYLGPEKFGLYSFATAFIGLFGAIAGLGLQEIVVRDIVRNPTGKGDTLGSAALLLFTGGLFAYGLTLGAIFYLRPDDTLARVLVVILGSTILFKASEVAVYWFESQVQSKYTVWVQNGSFLVVAAIKVVLILSDAPLIAFAWATIAEALMVALLMPVMLGLRGPKLRRLRITLTRVKELLSDSWPLLLSGIAIMIYMRMDQIMLGQMIGDEAVGVYTAATRISEVWYFIPVLIASSVFPTIIETKKLSEVQYYQRLQHLYDFVVVITAIFSFPLWIFSQTIIQTLFGVGYNEASFIFDIYIWNTVLVGMGVVRGKWIMAEDLQNLTVFFIGFSMIINVACNYFLIPNYGGIGAAWSTVISTFSATIVIPMLFRKTRVSSLMLLRACNPLHLVSSYVK